jgi:hypothetical protein
MLCNLSTAFYTYQAQYHLEAIPYHQ